MKVTHDIHSNLTFWVKNHIQKNKDSTYHFCINIDADEIQSAEYFALFPFTTDPLKVCTSTQYALNSKSWCQEGSSAC